MFEKKFQFFKNILGNGKFFSSTKEAEFHCPYCSHHKNKLAVNLQMDIFKCWVCGKSGTVYNLLEHQAPNKLSEYLKNYKPQNTRIKEEKDKPFSISLPAEYRPLIDSKSSILCKSAFGYLKDRNVDESIILKHKLGFCSTGLYSKRIIIPSFDKSGNLNFFTGRDISGLAEQPYLNEKIPKGYKNTIIINELNVDFNDELVIVEGFFDLFNSTENTVALCGSSLEKNSFLFQTIVAHQTKTILALDPDAFYKKTLKIAKLMLSYGINVSSVDFRPFKDLGKMSKKEGIDRIKNATIIDENYIRRCTLKGLFNDN